MNKSIVIVVATVVIVAAGVIGFLVATKDSSDKKTATKTSDHSDHAAINACEKFTLAEAKSVMGEATEPGTNAAPAASESVNVSTCSYTFSTGDVKSIRVATLMVRAPLDDTGVKSNQEAFNGGAATGEVVSGYGEKAYWSKGLGQLNILKDDVWYSVVYGGTNPQNNTVADAKLVADKVIAD